jgi:predicted RNase H-like HicB family nuclease
MLTAYIQAAMRAAGYEILKDCTFFGRIPPCKGVWANEPSLEACREELQSVLEDWILFRVERRLNLPTIEGINPNARQKARGKRKVA